MEDGVIMKRLVFVIAPLLFVLTALFALTGCSQSSAPQANPVASASASNSATSSSTTSAIYTVPQSCTATSILAAIKPVIKNAVFVDTKWQPAAGTELADFLNNKGIACSFGDAPAGIGVTVKWVSNAADLFTKREAEWTGAGHSKVDLAHVDESAAYFLFKPVGGKQEFQVWELNFLINGTWIAINASYLQDLASATPLINAALESALVK